MAYKPREIFLPFCHNSRVWQTDGRTDGRTDGQTEFSSQYRVCITCSAVKTWHLTLHCQLRQTVTIAAFFTSFIVTFINYNLY